MFIAARICCALAGGRYEGCFPRHSNSLCRVVRGIAEHPRVYNSNGLGYAQDTLKIEVQRSIVHAISIVALVWVFGFFGFCAAFTVSIFYNYYITNHYYKKRVGHAIHLFEYLSNWKTDIAIASLLVIAYVFVHFFGLASYFGCAVFVLGLAGCYGLLTWQLHFFTIEDFKEIAGPALSGKIFSWLKNAQ